MKEDLIGLATIQEVYLSCKHCNKKIAHIEAIETNDSRVRRNLPPMYAQYKLSNCPFCDGHNKAESFWSEILEGTTIAGSLNDNIILESVDISAAFHHHNQKLYRIILYARKK